MRKINTQQPSCTIKEYLLNNYHIVFIIIFFILSYICSLKFYPSIFGDEFIHNRMTRIMPFRHAWYPCPLYYFVYKLSLLSGDNFIACVKFFNSLFYSISLYFIYLTSKHFFQNILAFFVIFVISINHFCIYLIFFMPESMYHCFFWIMTYYMLVRLKPDFKTHIIASLLLAILSLIKPHAFFLLPALLCYSFTFLHNSKTKIAKSIYIICAFFISFFVFKFLIGYILAGKYALTIFGSYTSELPITITSLKSYVYGAITFHLPKHIKGLFLLFSPAIALCIYYVIDATLKKYSSINKWNLLSLYLFFTCCCLIVAVTIFENRVLGTGPYQLSDRMRFRYYDFIFPLFYILIAHALQGAKDIKKFAYICIAFFVICICLFVSTNNNIKILASIVDAPLLYIILTRSYLAHLFLVLSVFTIFIAIIHTNKCFFRMFKMIFAIMFCIVPLISTALIYKTIAVHASVANKFTKAGLFIKHNFGEKERKDFCVFDRALGPSFAVLFWSDMGGKLCTASDNVFFSLRDIMSGAPIKLYDGRNIKPNCSYAVVTDDSVVFDDTPLFNIRVGDTKYIYLKKFFEIDFRQSSYKNVPFYSIHGTSIAEPWGTWSIGNTVTINFVNPLPKKFKLTLSAHAFPPSADSTCIISAGNSSFTFQPKKDKSSFDFMFDNVDSDTITIFIPFPTSPRELGQSDDPRKLGIGMEKIRIEIL